MSAEEGPTGAPPLSGKAKRCDRFVNQAMEVGACQGGWRGAACMRALRCLSMPGQPLQKHSSSVRCCASACMAALHTMLKAHAQLKFKHSLDFFRLAQIFLFLDAFLTL